MEAIVSYAEGRIQLVDVDQSRKFALRLTTAIRSSILRRTKELTHLFVAVFQSNCASNVAASAPTNCATMKVETPRGEMLPSFHHAAPKTSRWPNPLVTSTS